MEFISKIHGNINYEEKDVIIFKKGLPGLDEYKKYALISLEEYAPFKLLHSLENDELALVVVSPFDIEKEYEISLKDEIKKELDITSPEEVMVLTTVTLNSKVENITTNLCAPIIININNNMGEQIIIDNKKYKIKHPIMKG